jgi:hypothetical protein
MSKGRPKGLGKGPPKGKGKGKNGKPGKGGFRAQQHRHVAPQLSFDSPKGKGKGKSFSKGKKEKPLDLVIEEKEKTSLPKQKQEAPLTHP